MSAFWNTWRREIIRGGALFVGVVGVGLFVRSFVGRVREGVVNELPAALRDLRGEFDPELAGGPRASAEPWHYRARIAPRQWVWIRNINGSVTVEPAKGDSLEVTAVKTYRRSDPASVRLVAVPYDGGVSICAVWPGSDAACEPGGEGVKGVNLKHGSARRNDVAVEFTVRLPRRVRVGATTVNGGVRVAGASAPIVASTVSGDVDAETSAGPVSAASVNGGVRARMRTFGDTGAVSLFTVNGAVTAELPPQLDADVEATTVNGSIHTDYPLGVSGKYVSHKLQGTLGGGGRAVHITTVNGSITLKKAL